MAAKVEEAKASASSNNDNEKPTISLTPNDILLGRGTAINENQGNIKFRTLAEERKEEYNNAVKNKAKSRLAKEFLDELKAAGMRFLRLDETKEPVDDIIEDGTWEEVEEEVAIEKIKQAFRQRRGKEETKKEKKAGVGAASLEIPEALTGAVSPSPAVLPPTLIGASAVDPQPFLFQSGFVWPLPHAPVLFNERMALIVQQDLMHSELQNLIRTQQLVGTSSDSATLEHVQNQINYDHFQDTVKAVRESLTIDADISEGPVSKSDISESTPSKSDDHSNVPDEDDTEDGALALFALAFADWPKLTREEQELEKESMTNEERASALADLFGKFCSVADYHPQKRARQDLDKRSIQFLIRQMKLELDTIPANKKQALLEAQTRCRPEEFSDERYERFLRSQGMNTKLAAQRFVNYWDSRRALLGPDKYHLRMTLSEAFCDDIDALKSGVFCILPSPDLSGRPLIVVQVYRITCDGFTPESLVRSVWYLMEIMAREHEDFIWILSHKGAKFWNYNRYLITHIPYYYSNSWPIRMMPTHVFGSNKFVTRIIRPVLSARSDKAGRCRALIHDCPESEELGVLAEYGIQKDMVPIELGGTVDLDEWLTSWIAQRRSIEMEEI